jgi:hypothetical protein
MAYIIELPQIKISHENIENVLDVFFRKNFSINLFQFHAALALARAIRNCIAHAGSPAIAEIDPGSFQTDPLHRATARTFCGIFRVKPAAFTTLFACTEERFISLNLDNVSPLHGLSASTISWFSAYGIAFTFRTAVAGIQDILSLLLRRSSFHISKNRKH